MSVQPYSESEPYQEPEAPPEEAEAGPTPDRRHFWLRCGILALIAALAGLSYAWAANQVTLEYYYAGTVRSMSGNWHDFIFGAVDPAGTISLDKLPGAFWLQALAVRGFGFHPWVLVLPQVVEGVLTVLILYRAVSRLSTPTAGLIAAAIVAVSPATVALNRGNISDSLMILLLVLAADAVSGAIARGREGPLDGEGGQAARGVQARLILAGVWVGLAFQAKMIEAWLVLPAFGLAFLLDGPGPLARRIRQVVVGGLVAGIVSLAWMTAVTLTPAAQRPYADGSSNNSVYAQVFVYNGFGRFGDQTPLQLLAAQIAPEQSIPIKQAGPDRLFTGNLGRDAGWLLPAAILAGIWGIARRWRRPRGDGLRASFVLWGAWLLILGVTFSTATYIQTYYTAALTPAIAALLALAAVTILGQRTSEGTDAEQPRSELARRLGLAIASAGTTAYAVWLVPAGGAYVPGWLVPAIIAVGAVAVVIALGSALIGRAGLAAAAMASVLAAALLAPAVASAVLAANDASAFDTPFESPKLAAQIAGAPARLAQLNAGEVPQIQNLQGGAPDLLAAQSSYVAALFIYLTGEEALPIGGFDGTIPSPTLSQLEADLRNGQFHLVLSLSTADPRIRWIAGHCQTLRPGRSYACASQGQAQVGPTTSPVGATTSKAP